MGPFEAKSHSDPGFCPDPDLRNCTLTPVFGSARAAADGGDALRSAGQTLGVDAYGHVLVDRAVAGRAAGRWRGRTGRAPALAPDRPDGRAARDRHVRLDRDGADPDGLRSQPRGADERHWRAHLLP